MKRVLVIVNKWWECDPALAAMLCDNTRPKGSPWPPDLQPTRRQQNPNSLPSENQNPLPRATFPYKTFSGRQCQADIHRSAKVSGFMSELKNGEPNDGVHQ
jgi:hypothetical protein